MSAMQPIPEPFGENFSWEMTLAESFSVNTDDDYDLDLFLPEDTPFEDQLALDTLLDEGFSWEEGIRLILLKENIYDIPEMIERITEDPHILFTRWMYQQGILMS